MSKRLLTVALIAALLVPGAADRPVRAQESASFCADETAVLPAATPVPDQRLTTGLPAGLALTTLASQLADELPTEPARLQLTRLSFEPGAGTAATRQAAGPILFYVVEGSVTIYLGGDPSTLAPGSSALVPLDDLYALVNAGEQPATLLRLAIAPRDEPDVPVAIVITPPPLLQTPVAGPPTGTLLFRAEITSFPATPLRLFLACLDWTAPGIDSGEFRHPGPVGLRMLSGSVTVDATREIPETGCTLLEANPTHRLQGGDPAPLVLVFGAIPDGQDLWLPPDASASASSSTPPELSCGAA